MILLWVILAIGTVGGIVDISIDAWRCHQDKVAFDECVKHGGAHGFCRNKTMKHECDE